ncbi:MAG TPA: Rne/Rng family ribonuclease [Clostridia bacterium]|nr:Rne/Rng family ribonuclease [Clostridia bacterium]
MAVLEENKLVEIYLDPARREKLVGSIYMGRVANVLPGMQAAFIDIGMDKNAFLYVEDALSLLSGKLGNKLPGKKEGKPRISDIVKVGQEIPVQVLKEAFGSKGPRVTTRISLPGRYLVFIPGSNYLRISRRIKNEEERVRLKDLMQKHLPAGTGAIIRTAALGAGENELQEDLRTLNLLWKRLRQRMHRPAPALIHKDLELVQRFLRDLFVPEVDRLLVNSREIYRQVVDYADLVMPRFKSKVHFQENTDLFSQFNITTQIEQALRRKVWLNCGGYLVIDRAEALTVIDVNTGKFVGTDSFSATVLKVNLEAAGEIARQLRLRNIGGIIIIDFIDMQEDSHWEQILEELDSCLKRDRIKSHVLGITRLGLVEITRKKARQGLEHVMLKDCPHCQGRGKVLSEELL